VQIQGVKLDKTALTDRAWELIAEAISSGSFTLDTHRVELKSSELVTLFRWLASLDAVKRRHAIDLPEDLRDLLPGP
jgi:hypothetical protein